MWKDVKDKLPVINNLVLVKDGDCLDFNIYVAYLMQDGNWYLNSPIYQGIELNNVFEWIDIPDDE